MPEERQANVWDVIVIGAGIAGSATAYRLLENNSKLRVLVVDRASTSHKKIGESTVEVSSYFLGRTLNLTEYLTRCHVIKQGLRFWFSNDECATLDDCSEIGPSYHVNLPAYQVDRAELDEEVLRRAQALGAEVLRPVRVRSIDLQSGGSQTVVLKSTESETTHTARWVVDASGPACVLARQEGWLQPNTRHQTSSIWVRYQNVLNFDDAKLRARFPCYSQRCHGSRNTATNHITGDGWWSWWIVLKSGEVSVGVVYDERLVQFPEEVRSLEARMRWLLDTSPLAREILQDATLVEDSVVYRGKLPYVSESLAGNGYVLVGDAAGFLDPFYSPGMDWIAFTTGAAVDLIGREKGHSKVAKRINTVYRRSYDRWFQALYEDKYLYLGDYDFMRMAMILDLGGYYFGVVRTLFQQGSSEYLKPVFGELSTTVPFWIIRCYNRRLAKMAASRRARGVFGRNNRGKAHKLMSYTLDWRLPVRLTWSLRIWLWLELREGWRTWFRKMEAVVPAPNLRPKL
ncbi:NAD(P)/FAD-dependent oxidoreductase [Coraliomargarita sp. W4R53]